MKALVRFLIRMWTLITCDLFHFEILRQDFRYAGRQLGRNPGFAITAILTLALGIGASTAVFSVAYGVLIDPFPYKDVHTLVTPKLCSPASDECGWLIYSPQQFNEIVEHTNIFNGVTASTISRVDLTGNFAAQRLRGNYITPNTFDVLGVRPLLGRATVEGDVQPGHEEVALLSYRYWQAHYGGSPSIIGRVLTFNHRPRTIIGVMPPRFLWRGADVYLPIQMTNEPEVQGQRDFALVGRLKPGVTEAQATAELTPIFEDFAKTEPFMFPKNFRLGIMPFDEMFKSGLARTLHLLLGSVFVLLFIACVNVSSLLLARAVNREHEFVVRAAVGASRLRLIRNALTESLLLAIAAIPIALAFAYAGLQAILRIVPTNTIPDEASVTLNIPVLLGSLGIALATVILVGLAPALHSANPHLAAALNSIRSSGSRTKRRLLSGFVVTEIALSLALLMLAGLMVRSLLKVESVAVPFSPDHTLTMRVPLSDERYSTPDMRIHFFRELLDRASAVPGVNQATVDAVSPFMDMYVARMQLDSQSSEKHLVSIHLTDPAYLGISSRKMLLGHFLDAREISAASHEVVITENFAKRYFSGQNVIGQTIYLPGVSADRDKKTSAGGGQQDDAFTIVGVMSDLPSFIGLGEDYPHIFIPYTVAPSAASVLILSTALPADGLVNPVRQIVYSMDKDQPVIEAMSLRHMLDMYGYAGPRFLVALFGSFAMAALLISLVGIYGVLSFTTSQRTHEIGVRMALGANRAHVMWLVLRQACMLALLGVAMGLPLAFLAAHLAKSELVHTSLYDPLTIVMVVCVLPLLAVAGTYLPARRAAATDPVIALRAE